MELADRPEPDIFGRKTVAGQPQDYPRNYWKHGSRNFTQCIFGAASHCGVLYRILLDAGRFPEQFF